MKKATKPLIVIGIIFCVFGTITMITAAGMGSTFNVFTYMNDTVVEDLYSDHEYEEADTELFIGEFNAIDLDLGISEVMIMAGDEFQVSVANQKEDYECYVKNNTLIVKSGDGFFNLSNFGKDQDLSEALILDITVPEGLLLEEIKIGIGVGDVLVTDVACSKLEIESGVGNVSYSGSLEGKSEIESGVGNVDLYLTESEKAYNYKISTGVGDISIGGDSYQGTFGPAAEYKVDNNSNKKLDIETGVGDVTIDFN